MKYKCSMLILAIVISLLCFIPALADKKETFNYLEWGKALKNNSKDNSLQSNMDDIKILLKGENAIITVSEVEMGKKFYQASGIPEDEAKNKSIDYFMEYESLYSEADKKGYYATEKEIENYLEQMKESIFSEETDEDTKEQFNTIISQFDSEKDYWEYEKEVYKKQLPIQKYVNDLEKKYFKENPGASDDEWLDYFEIYKKELVSKENFKSVD